MKRNIIAFLIAIVIIVSVAIFTGCIGKETTVSTPTPTPPTVESFIKDLENDNPYIVAGAADGLRRRGEGERAVKPLIRALGTGWLKDRTAVAHALARIGEPAVEPLIQALEDEDFFIRGGAAEALGLIGDKRAVEPLIKALRNDSHSLHGEYAAIALGKIGDERAVEPLIEALQDIAVDDYAVEALVMIGEPAVVPLIRALKEKRGHWTYGNAARALGLIGDKRAVEPLIEALRNDTFNGGAAIALGRIGDKRAVKPLIEQIEPPFVSYDGVTLIEMVFRRDVINALGMFGNNATEAVPILIRIAKNPEEWGSIVTGSVPVGAPYKVYGGIAVPVYEGGMKMRAGAGLEAAQALGKIGYPGTVESLTQALNDEDKGVRSAAARSLRVIEMDMVLQKYVQGKISISKAAEDTGLTVEEIGYLVGGKYSEFAEGWYWRD